MQVKNNIDDLNIRLRNKDIKAFRTVYNNGFNNLQRFAMRYVYDWQEAENIVQDAYFWLWDNIQTFDIKKNVYSYLLGIVKHRCLNHLRTLDIQDRHRDKIIEALLYSGINNNFDNYLDDNFDEDIKERLYKVLDNIDGKQKEVLKFRFAENMSISQIAKEMSVSDETVKTHLKRVMKTLRENLTFILFGI